MSKIKGNLNLIFDFNAIAFLDENGLNLLDGGLNEKELQKPSTIYKLIQAGLLHDDPKITEDGVKKRLSGIGFKEVMNMTTTALQESIGTDDEGGVSDGS